MKGRRGGGRDRVGLGTETFCTLQVLLRSHNKLPTVVKKEISGQTTAGGDQGSNVRG